MSEGGAVKGRCRIKPPANSCRFLALSTRGFAVCCACRRDCARLKCPAGGRAIAAPRRSMVLNNEQQNAIYDAVPGLLAFVDAERRYAICNRAYAAWFGGSV